MKKIFYLLTVILFVTSCSTSQFTKNSDFNGKRMNYAHKDVVKKQIDRPETPEIFKAQASDAEEISSITDGIDIKPSRKDIKNFVKKAKDGNVAEAIEAIGAEKIVSDYAIPGEFSETVLEQAYESASAKSMRMDPTLETLLLIAVALFVPFGTILAVGYVNDWDIMPMVYNFLWLLLCGIPGLIHALIHIFRR